MSITIGSNITSLQAQRAFSNATDKVGTASERLASGLRINRASDDVAGLAISEQLNSDSKVFTQAIRNVNDGISALTIAESAISELSEIVVRIRELATQSANGAISNTQRASLDEEAQALSKEFTRIQQSTEFNGMGLLNGATDGIRIQAGYGIDGSVSSSVGEYLADGTFGSLTETTSGSRAQVVELVDVNNDGLLDSVGLYRGSGRVAISLGNGDGTFVETEDIDTGPAPWGMKTGDLNGDGYLDVVTSADYDANDLFTVHFGNGDGTLQEQQIYETASGGSGDIALGDLNGDGLLDIVVGHSDGEVRLNQGNGDFSVISSYAPLDSPAKVELADLNDDGHLDIFSPSGGGVDVCLGNGNGTFESRINYNTEGGSHIREATAADLNNDGILDIIATNRWEDSISVLIGKGNGTFEDHVDYQAGGNAWGVKTGDLNGDGILDAAVANLDGDISLFYGKGDGTFHSAITIFDEVGSTKSIAFGDVNQDGVLDIAIADYNSSGRTSVALGGTRSGVNPLLEFSLKNRTDALNAMDPLDRKLELLNSQRGLIGSFQSRLEVSKNVLQVSTENFKAAESRVKDADIAQEAADLARTQILQQASSAVLAQANQQPSLAIQLLG